MPRISVLIPAYHGEDKLREVVEGCSEATRELRELLNEELYCDVVVSVNGRVGEDGEILDERNEATLDAAQRLRDNYQDGELITLSTGPGKTRAIREAFGLYNGQLSSSTKVYQRPSEEPEVIGIIDCDAQQKPSEVLGPLVPGLLRGDYQIGRIQRRKPIQMPEERIEKWINQIIVEALEGKYRNRDLNLRESRSWVGPGGGVKDLQNNVCTTYEAMKNIAPEILGEQFSLELEITLLALIEGLDIGWELRNDYGEPGPFDINNVGRNVENLGEKIYTLSEHTGIPIDTLYQISQRYSLDPALKDRIAEPAFERARGYQR